MRKINCLVAGINVAIQGVMECLLLCGLICIAGNAAIAQAPRGLDTLHPLRDTLYPLRDTLSFQEIDDGRYEGFVDQNVSGSSLYIRSFIAAGVQDLLPTDTATVLQYPLISLPPNDSIHILAQNLTGTKLYRMQKTISREHTRYTWPMSRLIAGQLKSESFGLLAWTKITIGASLRECFIPIVPFNMQPKTGSLFYVLQVMPGADCKKVSTSINEVLKDGTTRQVRPPTSAGGSYYPAGRPIRIWLSYQNLTRNTIYSVTVSAELEDGKSTSFPFYFFHMAM